MKAHLLPFLTIQAWKGHCLAGLLDVTRIEVQAEAAVMTNLPIKLRQMHHMTGYARAWHRWIMRRHTSLLCTCSSCRRKCCSKQGCWGPAPCRL